MIHWLSIAHLLKQEQVSGWSLFYMSWTLSNFWWWLSIPRWFFAHRRNVKISTGCLRLHALVSGVEADLRAASQWLCSMHGNWTWNGKAGGSIVSSTLLDLTNWILIVRILSLLSDFIHSPRYISWIRIFIFWLDEIGMWHRDEILFL